MNLLNEKNGTLEKLKAAEYNARSAGESFGDGVALDKDIYELAKSLGIKFPTANRGRQLNGGFFATALKVNPEATST